MKVTRLVSVSALAMALTVSTFTALPASAVVATTVQPPSGENNGFTGVTVNISGDKDGTLVPSINDPVVTPEPPKRKYCEMVEQDKLDKDGNQIIIKGVVQREEVEKCEMKYDLDWSTVIHDSGIAYWGGGEVFVDTQAITSGSNGGRVERTNPPSVNAPSVSKDYYGECSVAQRTAQGTDPMAFMGTYQPIGVKWVSQRLLRVNGNHELSYGPLNVNYFSESENGCVWPAIQHVTNTCPLWAGNAVGSGPFGEGLPVRTGPNVGDIDPTSIAREYPGLLTIEEGLPIYRTPMGKAERRGIENYSGEVMAGKVSSCNKELTRTFTFPMAHAGQYYVSAEGAKMPCSYMQLNWGGSSFLGFAGCGSPISSSPIEAGWKDCDGRTWSGINPDVNFDYSCSEKKPYVDVVCATPSPSCPTVVDIPDPIEDPANPGNLVPVRVPGSNTIICRWDHPTVTQPGSNRVLPTLNKAYTIGATGETWRLNWGDMSVENAPNVQNAWTDYFVESGSTPGNPDERASSDEQPFRGEYNNEGVLMWSDPEDNDEGKGIEGRDWARTLNLNWYQAGLEGVSESSLYTVYQVRNFTWQENLPQQNWDGSWTDGSQLIPIVCPGPSASFIVVGGRNATGVIR